MARIRRDGGIPAALAEIGRTASTSAKRVAYEALLDGGDLTDEDVERLVQQAGRDLSSSDGELRAVLARVPRAGHLTPRAGAAAVAVAGRITSDGEKRAVLQQYALGGDHDLLVAAMRQARQITSDGEKSALLRTVVERYLGTDDETLRAAYFGAAETIVSDGEHRSALAAALPYARVSPQVVLGVIEGARHITSDGEKAELLVAVLRQRALTTPAQREALMRATRTISSDSEYRRVMEVALQQ
jgi:hypothetical protein